MKDPKEFVIIDSDGPFYPGDPFWRLNDNEARRATWEDDYSSENFLMAIGPQNGNPVLCSNKNTILDISL